MSGLDIEEVVVVVKRNGVFRWYRSDRELWVLDLNKWSQDFHDAGCELPELDPSERFGLPVVNEHTIDRFLAEMQVFEIPEDRLAKELAARFPDAESWWDVGHLFPIMFLDCDRRRVAAFYYNGTRMERYIPDGWSGQFVDFATQFSEEEFPISERFWVQNGYDMLRELNERGKAIGQ
jgi:hypothetical protein